MARTTQFRGRQQVPYCGGIGTPQSQRLLDLALQPIPPVPLAERQQLDHLSRARVFAVSFLQALPEPVEALRPASAFPPLPQRTRSRQRHSGIAFTSERLLLRGEIPRISAMNQRLTSRPIPYSEPSATIVWRALYELGIEERTILWNALQMHPHRPGEEQSNRTPTSAEIQIGKPALKMLVAEFPSAKVVAVGKKAERLLRSMGVPAATVRHPANGGAAAFAQELKRLASG